MNLTAPLVLLDTGPWVALRCRDDSFHALAPMARGVVRIGINLDAEIAAVQAQFKRHDKLPASLADGLPGSHE